MKQELLLYLPVVRFINTTSNADVQKELSREEYDNDIRIWKEVFVRSQNSHRQRDKKHTNSQPE